MEVANSTLHWVFAGTPRSEKPGGPPPRAVFASSQCFERSRSEKSGKRGGEQLEDHSFNLHELAVLSASLGLCVPEDAAGRLESILKVHAPPLTRGISEASSMKRLILFFHEGNFDEMTRKKL